MSQQDVITVLEKNKRPLSVGEIAKELNQHPYRVSHSLRRMLKIGDDGKLVGRDIKIMEIDCRQAMKLYKCKKRMRLYYL